MCDSCGCGQPDSSYSIFRPDEEMKHQEKDNYSHDHTHEHDDKYHPHSQKITVEKDILQKNNLIAERNRGFFEAKGVLSLNLVSSPGSGKTCLIERTIKDLSKEINFFIVEGDQQTMLDA